MYYDEVDQRLLMINCLNSQCSSSACLRSRKMSGVFSIKSQNYKFQPHMSSQVTAIIEQLKNHFKYVDKFLGNPWASQSVTTIKLNGVDNFL